MVAPYFFHKMPALLVSNPSCLPTKMLKSMHINDNNQDTFLCDGL